MESLSSLGDTGKPFIDGSVYGCLHSPVTTATGGVVLTHGAGSNFESPLLVVVASQLALAGFYVLRCNLAFRQRRRSGPPHPSGAGTDRESLREAVAALRRIASGKLILGGHSYGGRQASILASDDPSIADSLLLLSYPLHPPAKPATMRTSHFPKLTVPCLFVHGTKDGFGTADEMQTALKIIDAPTALSMVQGAGHELAKGRFDFEGLIINKLL